MPPGTRVRVAGRGDGTVEGFEGHWIGANEYIIRFDSEGQPTAVKLRDEPTAVSVNLEHAPGGARSGGAWFGLWTERKITSTFLAHLPIHRCIPHCTSAGSGPAHSPHGMPAH